MSDVIYWGVIAVPLFVIYWSWCIISSIAEDLLKARRQVNNLSVALRDSNYELDCLKKSILNTSLGATIKSAMPLQLINKMIQFCHPDKHEPV